MPVAPIFGKATVSTSLAHGRWYGGKNSMNPVPHPAGSRARGVDHRVDHACDACGQVFTLHYSTTTRVSPPCAARVPCLNDACGIDVVVLLPSGAFAVWTEEISF